MASPFYFSDESGDLFQADPTTLVATEIGDLGVSLTDIAATPDGRLFGITFSGLYAVNPVTAQATFLRSIDLHGANAFVFAPSGEAYIASNSAGGIYGLNLATGDVVAIGGTSRFLSSSGDLTFHNGQFLFSTTAGTIAFVDPFTGNVLRQVHHDVPDLYGLASDGFTVYGFANSEAYRFDLVTGEEFLVQDYPSSQVSSIYGSATVEFGQSGKILRGNGFPNLLFGTAKNDICYGAGGGDKIHGLAGADIIFGGPGRDFLFGNAGNDVIFGGAGNDRMLGGLGFDRLIGGTGRDVMTGGGQRDIFDFDFVGESGRTFLTRDVITDFRHLVDDIDLSDIDGRTGVGGDQAFTFIGTAVFTGVQGQLRFFFAGANKTIVAGDTNGNGVADFQIELTGHKSLSAADFII